MKGIRFAPSPTGRFHVGNLRTAWISWKIAKTLGELWVVRFEDIDGPRSLPGAQAQQLADMATLGLKPDEIVIQSHNRERHWQLFEKAMASGQVYRCTCSRKDILQELETLASAPHAEPALYTGHCRSGSKDTAHPTVAWRFRDERDKNGAYDFIVARTPNAKPTLENFAPAYHWACAIDDHDGDYKLLVRAWDLAHARISQAAVHDWVAKIENSGRAAPMVFHTSLLVQNDGHRLEKRTAGATLDELENAGIDPKKLLEIFEKSFTSETPFRVEKTSGEEKKTLLWREMFSN